MLLGSHLECEILLGSTQWFFGSGNVRGPHSYPCPSLHCPPPQGVLSWDFTLWTRQPLIPTLLRCLKELLVGHRRSQPLVKFLIKDPRAPKKGLD